jgi:hypothetical protein
MVDTARREVIGVTAPPASRYGAYALVATGFSGIGIAEAIQPNVLDSRYYSGPLLETEK